MIVQHQNKLYSSLKIPHLSFPTEGPASSAEFLLHVTHLELVGIRVDLDVLRFAPQLVDLTLNVGYHVSTAQSLYAEEDVLLVIEHLKQTSPLLRHLRISMAQCGIDTLRTVAVSLPLLETLYLVVNGAPFIPVTNMYPAECSTFLVRINPR